ncbi:MAG: DUF3299 domain-containing protein [Pseudomonadota bacterium]
MMRKIFLGMFTLIFLVVSPRDSLAIEQITWRDLTMPLGKIEDPYEGLEYDQRIDLDVLLTIERMREADGSLSDDFENSYDEIYSALQSAGHDPDDLIKKYNAYQARIAEVNSSIREDRHETEVRIPGYILPLEYQGDRITEFLLVPYVGACIHTPPPPANQIIHVKPNSSFAAMGLFTPVWVSGKLIVERSQQSVGLSDGIGNFAVGYKLEADKVVEYTE